MKKNIKMTDLVHFVNLTSSSSYNEERKANYRKLGKEILQEIADKMKLKKDEYDLRWNPGGIAVSGDHTLHTDWFYLALHDNVATGWFYFRTCKGRKDYSGGPNITYPWTIFTAHGLDRLIAEINDNCPRPK